MWIILLILVLALLTGGFGFHTGQMGYVYGGGGLVGTLIVVVLILALLGRL